MDWFQKIFGFEENKYNINKFVKFNTKYKDKIKINEDYFQSGVLIITTLKELKSQLVNGDGKIKLSQISSDIGNVHQNINNRDSLIQVASQFNLLEMIGPSYTPEMGITIYENDETQGPICAMNCPYGTLYRNYFTNVNTLSKIELIFDEEYWVNRNGYMIFYDIEKIKIMNKEINKNREILKNNIKFGIQKNTNVINTDYNVSQIYCSAVPISYNNLEYSEELELISRLILESAYEATFISSILNKKSNKVFITLIGGGAFGNKKEWILDAIEINIQKYKDYDIEIIFVKYGLGIDKDIEILEKKYNL